MRRLTHTLIPLLLLGPLASAERQIPESLVPWKDWATWQDVHRDCPTPFNNPKTHLCFWPSELSVTADRTSGSFALDLTVSHETWVPLPGNKDAWPLDVRANNDPIPVVDRSGIPSVKLQNGPCKLTGAFRWDEVPQRIPIPKSVGLLALALDGKPVDIPNWDAEGFLWLKRTRSEEADKDFLTVQIYRVIEDGIPMWLRTEIEISVSGKSREEEIGNVLPEGWKLSMVDAPVPIAVDDSGRMKAQVRAGKWTIRTDAFRTAHANEFKFASGVRPALDQELVAFRAKPDFRMVEVTGIPAIDVSQTTFPEKWRDLPVYQWATDKAFKLEEKMRGMGLQKPEGLKIQRDLWLDENGRAMTYRDHVTGAMQQIWRLDAAEGQELGAVKINGAGQLVTKNPKTGAHGVEVRARNLDLDAVGRMARSQKIAATGWRTDADALTINLNLPPGWRLLALFGAEWVSGDWLTAWSLLDLFLLLIFSLAIWRLWGPRLGILAFFAFGLAYHEPLAPRYTWLVLLMPLALLRVVPDGIGRRIVVLWKWIAIAALVVALIPFVAKQIQGVTYPQLETVDVGKFAGARMFESQSFMLGGAAAAPEAPPAMAQQAMPEEGKAIMLRRGAAKADSHETLGKSLRQAKEANLYYDPQARIQTGPGVPEWHWRQVSCGWNGPVAADTTIRPVLISLPLQRLLTILRVALLLALAAALLGARRAWNPFSKQAAVAIALLCLIASPAQVRAAEFPNAETLKTLRERLLEVPDAYPNAAEIPSVSLQLRDRRITIEAEIHSAIRVAVPLPGRLPDWSPVTVQVNGARPEALRRDADYLWVVLPQGVHHVHVEGLLPNATEWEWTFLLKPKYVSIDAPGWNVTGVRPNGIPEQQVFFAIQKRTSAAEAAYDRKDFNPIVAVDRHIEVGLVWQAHTVVTRLSPKGKAVSLSVPLLAGEKVLTSNIPVAAGRIEVRLGAAETEFSWDSELPVKDRIALESEKTDRWVERWHLVTSPVWNASITDLAPVFEVNQMDLVPVWHPWPGEKVDLAFSRPEAITGATTTIRQANHTISLGGRQRTSSLSLRVQCSLGDDLPFGLESDAEITSLKHNGAAIPVRKDAGKLVVPVKPGEQTIDVEWKTTRDLGFRASADLVVPPVESSNVNVTMRVPENRWVLWAHGPLLGPAVRFWTILVCALLAAQILASLHLTPLKRHQWALLALGLTQVDFIPALFVVIWLFALAWRGRRADSNLASPWLFNIFQIVLLGLTVFVVGVLLDVLRTGLLGSPEMFISGNGSTRSELRWFQARAEGALPKPWILSVSIWWYRFLMLAWALWLANALLGWIRWGWTQFSQGGVFRRGARKKPASPPVLPKNSA
ncbi:MAG TPA: hypothetical protein PLU30_08225 [Verrucomicrobiae bacterium]|nr:hypothetical protein [Verrucomicrobiae bacterium]